MTNDQHFAYLVSNILLDRYQRSSDELNFYLLPTLLDQHIDLKFGHIYQQFTAVQAD